jgi:hypothetical protein
VWAPQLLWKSVDNPTPPGAWVISFGII